MAVYLRRSVSGSRGALSSAICHRKPEREAPSVRLLAKQSPCRMHSSTTAIHRQTPSGDSKCSNETASQVAQSSAASPPDVRSQIKELEESLFKILCGPKPSNPLLVAIVRGLVKLAEQPSLEVIRAVASQFAETRDTHSSTAVLALLKDARRRQGGETSAHRKKGDDPIALIYDSLIHAHCGRQDVTGALAAVMEMDDASLPADVSVFLRLLRACLSSRPPMLRQAQAVWAVIEEKGLGTKAGVQQDLFTARMMVYSSAAGYSNLDKHQEESAQDSLKAVDRTWDDMLDTLAAEGGGDLEAVEESVTARSWISRAMALALCARDAGLPESDSALSRSLEALQRYQGVDGAFGSSDEALALAEIIRALARCGRYAEVSPLLMKIRQIAPVDFNEDSGVTATDNPTQTADNSATQIARVPEEVLRALGARGYGFDDMDEARRRVYGHSLLKVIKEIAAEASLRGAQSHEAVQSRLTATLQAMLTASHFLDRQDADRISAAARAAMDATADAAVTGHGREGKQPGVMSHEERQSSGPSLSALSLFALLHVSKQPREGLPVVVDVLQEMHDREMVPPAALAAKLEVIFKRHGTARQKYRGRFLLARALAEFDGPEQDEEGERGEEAYGVGQSRSGGGVSSGVGLGDAIRGMVRSSTTRRADEWDTKPIAMPEGSGNPKSGVPDVGDASHANSSAEESYQLLRQRLARPSNLSTRVGSVEQACNDEKEGGEERLPPSGSHSDVVRQVAVLAERGRAHAALSALQTIDGRKKGLRVAVPYRVYASLFRALSNMYSERGKEEVELAAAPMESLQWLLRGMARQGHKPDSKLLNFGLEAFACAAKSRKVREGGAEARARVCTEAMDFLEGMRDGWNGLHPPVLPNVVSFSIVIKIMCRLQMFEQAFEVLEVMEQSGCIPDEITYSTLIHGLSRAGDNDGAWEVMVTMTNRGITPRSIAIDGIMDGYVQSGQVGEAISFAQHAFNQYGNPPTAQKFCRVVRAAADLDDGKHEARRAVIVAEQMWSDEWRGEGRSSHPVLGHPHLREMLETRGVFDDVQNLSH